jgi:prevent-host-death family protein
MFVLDANAKGNIAEQAIVLEAMKLGVPILQPVGEHYRCDLAFDLEDRIWRVQCKWGSLSSDRAVIRVSLCGNRCTPNGYVVSKYTPEEVDLFAVYCGELDRCYLVPGALGCGRRAIWLRLSPTRNNQRSCINLAADFDFEGAIAQLGERRAGSAKVAGSSPASSTPETDAPTVIGCDEFRVRFSTWLDRVAAGEDVLLTYRGRPRVRLTPPTSPTPAPRTLRTPP